MPLAWFSYLGSVCNTVWSRFVNKLYGPLDIAIYLWKISNITDIFQLLLPLVCLLLTCMSTWTNTPGRRTKSFAQDMVVPTAYKLKQALSQKCLWLWTKWLLFVMIQTYMIFFYISWKFFIAPAFELQIQRNLFIVVTNWSKIVVLLKRGTGIN